MIKNRFTFLLLLAGLGISSLAHSAKIFQLDDIARLDDAARQQRRERGFSAHERGELELARRAYREVLRDSPDDLDVMHALGIAEIQSGQYHAAVPLLASVARYRPEAAVHADLGNALLGSNRLDEALGCYDRALALQPGLAAAHVNRGHALKGLGRREEAAASYGRATEAAPAIIGAHVSRAAVLLELGRWREALTSSERAIELGIDTAEAHTLCGLALAQLGRVEDARRRYERALVHDESYVPALVNTGILMRSLHRPEEAVTCYDRALALDPRSFEALCNRAAALIELGRFDAALHDCGVAASLRSDRPELNLHRAAALGGLGRHAEAIAACDAALAAGADALAALKGRAGAQRGLDRSADAVASYDQALALAPGDTVCHLGRGWCLLALERFEEALGSFDQAVGLDPDCREGFVGRAVALRRLNRLEAALADCDRTIELKADAAAFCNRGSMLTELNRCDDALPSFERALALDPGHPPSHFNRSIALLLSGRWETAWTEYEWRGKIEEKGAEPRRDFAAARWTGAESIAGRSVLLHWEQGFGDTLQFCRYAPRVAALGANVILEVQPALAGLLRCLPGVARVVAHGDPLPVVDRWCPLMSLPLVFETTLDTIPAAAGYLTSSAPRRERWESALGPRTRPRIGLSWRGSALHKHDHNRSLALARLLPHLPAGFQYVSLQRDRNEAEARLLQAHAEVFDAAGKLDDFSDTAALCDCLDLVISVDTSVAHLAGALGRPTWILLPWYPDWRWQLGRTDSPWYSSARLYRQPVPEDWPAVIAHVAADLERLL